MPYRKSLAETNREIKFLIEFIKFNAAHDHLGRFTTTGEAHILVHRDGRRELGPKHPDHPNNKLTEQQKAAKMLKEKYPATNFNFDGVDAKFAPRIAKHLDKLFTKYPGVLDSVRYVGTPTKADGKEGPPDYAVDDNGGFKLGPNAYAYASYEHYVGQGKFTSAMILNPSRFDDEARMTRSTHSDAASRWHPFGTHDPLSVVTHEFGHLLHYSMLFGGEGKAMPGLDFIGKGDKEGEVSRMTNYWSNLHVNEGYAISKYASSSYDKDKTSGLKEMFAESFAQLEHAPKMVWKPFTHSLESFLSTMGNSSSWTSKPRRVDLTKDSVAAKAALKKITGIQDTLKKSKETSILPPLPQEEVQLVLHTPHIGIEEGGYGPEPGKQ